MASGPEGSFSEMECFKVLPEHIPGFHLHDFLPAPINIGALSHSWLLHCKNQVDFMSFSCLILGSSICGQVRHHHNNTAAKSENKEKYNTAALKGFKADLFLLCPLSW